MKNKDFLKKLYNQIEVMDEKALKSCLKRIAQNIPVESAMNTVYNGITFDKISDTEAGLHIETSSGF